MCHHWSKPYILGSFSVGRGGFLFHFVLFLVVCFFPLLPFLVGQQMELLTGPYLSLQNQLLLGLGLHGFLCFGPCYERSAFLIGVCF